MCTSLYFHILPCPLHKNMVWTNSTAICCCFLVQSPAYTLFFRWWHLMMIPSECTVKAMRGIYTTYEIITQTTSRPSCARATRKEAFSRIKRLTLKPVGISVKQHSDIKFTKGFLRVLDSFIVFFFYAGECACGEKLISTKCHT